MIRLDSVELAAPAGDRLLVAGVSLDILSDEYVALAGPNGAGKSLLLQLLAGLRAPTGGVITFVNANVSCRRAIVFQSPDDQLVGSTVERDLAFGLENREVEPEEIRRRVDEALEWSGLGPSARRPPHLLSEGEKQRLALVSALLLEPDLLLLDEPTSRLDPPTRQRFLDEVRSFRERSGAAIVHVTHRSEEILPADRVVALRDGKIAFDGSPAELIASPDADRLGVVWSDLHRLRRELGRRGADLAPCRGSDWNRSEPLLEGLG